MKIVDLRPVRIGFPKLEAPKGRQANWHSYLPRGLPINRFEDYPPTLPGRTPGFRGREVWVQVTAEDGSFGIGRCSFGSPVAELVATEYAELLIGRDALATEFLNGLMWEASRRYGTLGHACVAISGIDLALWDLKGKLLDMPVYRLLGGPSQAGIPLYATTNDLEWALELGFTAIKLPNQVHWSQGLDGLQDSRGPGRACPRGGGTQGRPDAKPGHGLRRRVRHPGGRNLKQVRFPLDRGAADPGEHPRARRDQARGADYCDRHRRGPPHPLSVPRDAARAGGRHRPARTSSGAAA